jgi:hypothetical protein
MTFDLRGRLAAIRAPALVISGENDRLFSPDHGREISDQIAGSRCSVIPGAGAPLKSRQLRIDAFSVLIQSSQCDYAAFPADHFVV